MSTTLHPDDYADLCGDGYANEWQRCHAESSTALRREENPDDAVIAGHLAAGRFVSVRYVARYCRATDAYIGETRWLVNFGPTRAWVLEDLQQRYVDRLVNDEDRYEILPRELPVAPAQPAGVDEGVPF